MGVYIKGIEMPKENEGIQLWIRNDGTVECVKTIFSKGYDELTTLIGMEQTKATYIPEPHGRLIDEAKAMDILDEYRDRIYISKIIYTLFFTEVIDCTKLVIKQLTPTVIEGNEE